MLLNVREAGLVRRKREEDKPLDPGPPPDGGADAYTQAILAHLVCFNTWGFVISFGVFQTYYRSVLPEPPSDISWIGSTQVFLLFFIGAFSGRATDAGYFHLTYGAGVLLQLLGVFTTSVATSYWQFFLAQALCVGIGSGLQFCPVMSLVATYFSRRRTFALAFALCGAGTGGLVFPAIVRELLFRRGVGFGWTVRLLGFIMALISVVCFVLFKPRILPAKNNKYIEFAALKEKTYALFVMGMFFNFWALYFAFYYVGQFSKTVLGFSFEDSVDLLLLVNGVGICGRLIPAYLADQYTGPLNLLIPLAVITGMLYYCWAAVHNAAGVYVFAVLYGFASNTVQGLWPSALSSLTDDMSKQGARMGLGFTIVSFACLTGPPLGGALLRNGDTDYLPAQIWGGSCLILGAAILLAARLFRTGPKFLDKC